jgi:putative membrane protein
MTLSVDERQRIAAAIRAAEERSRGEIVCVLARVSADSTALPILIAAAAALALPWILMATTALSVTRLLEAQILLFVVLAAALSRPALRVALMPRAARRAVAHRMAMQQFVARGIARKADRCGILIFVSLAEHYARIVADDGIAAKVPQSEWQEAVDCLVAHAREGRIGDGFVAAINLCGDKLATHFPNTGAPRDELPDRVYLI